MHDDQRDQSDAGQAVQVEGGGNRQVRLLGELGQQACDHSGQDVAGAAFRHAGNLDRHAAGVGIDEIRDLHLAAARDKARHRHTGRLDLAVRDPARLERLQPVLPEREVRALARDQGAQQVVHEFQ